MKSFVLGMLSTCQNRRKRPIAEVEAFTFDGEKSIS